MRDQERLQRQIEFVLEVDKLKGIVRQTWLLDQSRRENDAEHSWSIAMMAVVLAEHAAERNLDVLRVLKMLLVHDLVEIDAGDTLVYDKPAMREKARRERTAADRIYGLLPPDQAAELRGLWEEFEARESPEARYAAAMDRLQPLLHNCFTQGKAWREHGIGVDQVLDANRHMAEGAPALWALAEGLVREAVRKGHLAE
jgi:putative hydrolase of HD superfamily